MSVLDIRCDKIQILTICEATSVSFTKAQPDLHAALVKVERVKCTSMAKAMYSCTVFSVLHSIIQICLNNIAHIVWFLKIIINLQICEGLRKKEDVTQGKRNLDLLPIENIPRRKLTASRPRWASNTFSCLSPSLCSQSQVNQ